MSPFSRFAKNTRPVASSISSGAMLSWLWSWPSWFSAGASAGWLQLNAIAPSADSRSVFFMLFKVNKYVILFNSITHRNVHGFYRSVLFGLEHVLHFHGFQDE